MLIENILLIEEENCDDKFIISEEEKELLCVLFLAILILKILIKLFFINLKRIKITILRIFLQII